MGSRVPMPVLPVHMHGYSANMYTVYGYITVCMERKFSTLNSCHHAGSNASLCRSIETQKLCPY